MTKINMAYFKSKIKALREEYVGADKEEFIKSKKGRCELCGRRKGDAYVFGPTHYIQKRILFKVDIQIHKIKSAGIEHKVCMCDGCHLSYHLFNRLEKDAMFGKSTVAEIQGMDTPVIARFLKRKAKK